MYLRNENRARLLLQIATCYIEVKYYEGVNILSGGKNMENVEWQQLQSIESEAIKYPITGLRYRLTDSAVVWTNICPHKIFILNLHAWIICSLGKPKKKKATSIIIF